MDSLENSGLANKAAEAGTYRPKQRSSSSGGSGGGSGIASSLQQSAGSSSDSSAATPSTFKRGGKVKKTGLAKVHKGERVLTAKQDKKRKGKRSKRGSSKR